MHDGNYQQLYHTSVDFCSSQEQIPKFRHFLELLYHTFVESYINQEYILLQMVIINSMFAYCFSFKMIRNEFQHFWISHYCSNTYFYRFTDVHIMFTINHFIYTKTQKKAVLSRLKIKTIFFIYTHDLQVHNFLLN